jgi:hypothetical protein
MEFIAITTSARISSAKKQLEDVHFYFLGSEAYIYLMRSRG